MFTVRQSEAEKESEGSAKPFSPQMQIFKIIVSLQLLPLQRKHKIAHTCTPCPLSLIKSDNEGLRLAASERLLSWKREY